MTTFLELCNAVERESGTVSKGMRMTDVTAPPTDRQDKIVNWVRDAWKLIQASRADWTFLVGEFSEALTIGQRKYDPVADWAIPRFSDWVVDNPEYEPVTIYDPALGAATESELSHASYEYWRQVYDRGSPQVQRPTVYAVGRNRELCFGDTPDKAYVVRGEYRKEAQVLAINADVPDMPTDYHDVIKWRALMLLGDHDEAPITIASAQSKMAGFYSGLVQRCTPPPSLSGNGGYFR